MVFLLGIEQYSIFTNHVFITRFYIGCDACTDWYHGSCVGITEDEAATIENYTCPKCKNQRKDASKEANLKGRDYNNLIKIVEHLQVRYAICSNIAYIRNNVVYVRYGTVYLHNRAF